MIELRFSPELYAGSAIEEAAKVYTDFGSFQVEQQVDAYVVRVEVPAADAAHSEQTLADEFANYALGATIEQRTDD